MARDSASGPSARGGAAQGVTFAILPVKRFGAAKVRLGDELSGGTRRALAEAMVTDVLMALRRTKSVAEALLVTSEPAAEAIGRGYGANVLYDGQEAGQSAATLIGIAHAIEEGATRVLLVPGDCPAVDPAELEALLDRPTTGRSVVIVPDRHGSGTNALLLTPPNVIEPAFGPDSRQRHEQAAAAAKVPCTVEHVETLALDVDTADDLAALRVALANRRGGAAHTRGMLSRIATTRKSAPAEPPPG
ncbi:MAG: 2-phospho-L-lactate/phosphoenolpyruvate guanylyltransferase [Solirubrobacteraceae bacterium]|jgi:2-phospho-L-lactate guanylyltransferase|nr:2-phospho-L-lactate/phosphoenolpyruvate guanylyltransferase [Solirubrobacteraceae bacterium]MEA2138607.1 2-phospho-L-lactate/phosphoenolpyruvate guanylyltransferase [Solirubrobacteraceae bacterium]